jgi:hypothetical protein
MLSKKCFKCNEIKSLSSFYKHSQMADGHLNKCKDCAKKDVRNNLIAEREKYRVYDIERNRNNFNRIFLHRYSSIKSRVEGRATRKYKIEGSKLCQKDEFIEWCYKKNILTKFNKLHIKWRLSGYQRNLVPSIDRIDNNKGYILSNIQWITLRDNVRKYYIPF